MSPSRAKQRHLCSISSVTLNLPLPNLRTLGWSKDRSTGCISLRTTMYLSSKIGRELPSNLHEPIRAYSRLRFFITTRRAENINRYSTMPHIISLRKIVLVAWMHSLFKLMRLVFLSGGKEGHFESPRHRSDTRLSFSLSLSFSLFLFLFHFTFLFHQQC